MTFASYVVESFFFSPFQSFVQGRIVNRCYKNCDRTCSSRSNTLDLISGGDRFESRPGHWVSEPRLFMVFLSSSDRPQIFLPDPFKFFSRSTIRFCIVSWLTASLNYSQKKMGRRRTDGLTLVYTKVVKIWEGDLALPSSHLQPCLAPRFVVPSKEIWELTVKYNTLQKYNIL